MPNDQYNPYRNDVIDGYEKERKMEHRGTLLGDVYDTKGLFNTNILITRMELANGLEFLSDFSKAQSIDQLFDGYGKENEKGKIKAIRVWSGNDHWLLTTESVIQYLKIIPLGMVVTATSLFNLIYWTGTDQELKNAIENNELDTSAYALLYHDGNYSPTPRPDTGTNPGDLSHDTTFNSGLPIAIVPLPYTSPIDGNPLTTTSMCFPIYTSTQSEDSHKKMLSPLGEYPVPNNQVFICMGPIKAHGEPIGLKFSENKIYNQGIETYSFDEFVSPYLPFMESTNLSVCVYDSEKRTFMQEFKFSSGYIFPMPLEIVLNAYIACQWMADQNDNRFGTGMSMLMQSGYEQQFNKFMMELQRWIITCGVFPCDNIQFDVSYWNAYVDLFTRTLSYNMYPNGEYPMEFLMLVPIQDPSSGFVTVYVYPVFDVNSAFSLEARFGSSINWPDGYYTPKLSCIDTSMMTADLIEFNSTDSNSNDLVARPKFLGSFVEPASQMISKGTSQTQLPILRGLKATVPKRMLSNQIVLKKMGLPSNSIDRLKDVPEDQEFLFDASELDYDTLDMKEITLKDFGTIFEGSIYLPEEMSATNKKTLLGTFKLPININFKNIVDKYHISDINDLDDMHQLIRRSVKSVETFNKEKLLPLATQIKDSVGVMGCGILSSFMPTLDAMIYCVGDPVFDADEWPPMTLIISKLHPKVVTLKRGEIDTENSTDIPFHMLRYDIDEEFTGENQKLIVFRAFGMEGKQLITLLSSNLKKKLLKSKNKNEIHISKLVCLPNECHIDYGNIYPIDVTGLELENTVYSVDPKTKLFEKKSTENIILSKENASNYEGRILEWKGSEENVKSEHIGKFLTCGIYEKTFDGFGSDGLKATVMIRCESPKPVGLYQTKAFETKEKVMLIDNQNENFSNKQIQTLQEGNLQIQPSKLISLYQYSRPGSSVPSSTVFLDDVLQKSIDLELEDYILFEGNVPEGSMITLVSLMNFIMSAPIKLVTKEGKSNYISLSEINMSPSFYNELLELGSSTFTYKGVPYGVSLSDSYDPEDPKTSGRSLQIVHKPLSTSYGIGSRSISWTGLEFQLVEKDGSVVPGFEDLGQLNLSPQASSIQPTGTGSVLKGEFSVLIKFLGYETELICQRKSPFLTTILSDYSTKYNTKYANDLKYYFYSQLDQVGVEQNQVYFKDGFPTLRQLVNDILVLRFMYKDGQYEVFECSELGDNLTIEYEVDKTATILPVVLSFFGFYVTVFVTIDEQFDLLKDTTGRTLYNTAEFRKDDDGNPILPKIFETYPDLKNMSYVNTPCAVITLDYDHPKAVYQRKSNSKLLSKEEILDPGYYGLQYYQNAMSQTPVNNFSQGAMQGYGNPVKVIGQPQMTSPISYTSPFNDPRSVSVQNYGYPQQSYASQNVTQLQTPPPPPEKPSTWDKILNGFVSTIGAIGQVVPAVGSIVNSGIGIYSAVKNVQNQYSSVQMQPAPQMMPYYGQPQAPSPYMNGGMSQNSYSMMPMNNYYAPYYQNKLKPGVLSTADKKLMMSSYKLPTIAKLVYPQPSFDEKIQVNSVNLKYAIKESWRVRFIASQLYLGRVWPPQRFLEENLTILLESPSGFYIQLNLKNPEVSLMNYYVNSKECAQCCKLYYQGQFISPVIFTIDGFVGDKIAESDYSKHVRFFYSVLDQFGQIILMHLFEDKSNNSDIHCGSMKEFDYLINPCIQDKTYLYQLEGTRVVDCNQEKAENVIVKKVTDVESGSLYFHTIYKYMDSQEREEILYTLTTRRSMSVLKSIEDYDIWGLKYVMVNSETKEIAIDAYDPLKIDGSIVNTPLTALNIPAYVMIGNIKHFVVATSDKNIFTAINTKGLSRIVFPHILTKIGNDTFKGCTNIKTISFSNEDAGTTTVGTNAFSMMGQIQNIFFVSKTVEIGDSAFDSTYIGYLHVPIYQTMHFKGANVFNLGGPVEFDVMGSVKTDIKLSSGATSAIRRVNIYENETYNQVKELFNEEDSKKIGVYTPLLQLLQLNENPLHYNLSTLEFELGESLIGGRSIQTGAVVILNLNWDEVSVVLLNDLTTAGEIVDAVLYYDNKSIKIEVKAIAGGGMPVDEDGYDRQGLHYTVKEVSKINSFGKNVTEKRAVIDGFRKSGTDSQIIIPSSIIMDDNK